MIAVHTKRGASASQYGAYWLAVVLLGLSAQCARAYVVFNARSTPVSVVQVKDVEVNSFKARIAPGQSAGCSYCNPSCVGDPSGSDNYHKHRCGLTPIAVYNRDVDTGKVTQYAWLKFIISIPTTTGETADKVAAAAISATTTNVAQPSQLQQLSIAGVGAPDLVVNVLNGGVLTAHQDGNWYVCWVGPCQASGVNFDGSSGIPAGECLDLSGEDITTALRLGNWIDQPVHWTLYYGGFWGSVLQAGSANQPTTVSYPSLKAGAPQFAEQDFHAALADGTDYYIRAESYDGKHDTHMSFTNKNGPDFIGGKCNSAAYGSYSTYPRLITVATTADGNWYLIDNDNSKPAYVPPSPDQYVASLAPIPAASGQPQNYFSQLGCGDISVKYGIIPRYTSNNAPQSVMDAYTQRGCDLLVCESLRVNYQIVPGVTWGTTPDFVQPIWLNAKPVFKQGGSNCDGACIKAPFDCIGCAIGYSINPGVSFNSAPDAVRPAWVAAGCTKESICSFLKTQYNIVPGSSFGYAPVTVQNWWVMVKCT